MIGDFLKKQGIASQAAFVSYGYGQVEPNHLSAQATKEVYAQLPADKEIGILENGQFAKYDYAKGVVDFDGAGEWMLVFNEIKLYRDGQGDAEFAMIKDNYQARVYSPYGGKGDDKQSRYYNGTGANSKGITVDNVAGTITFGEDEGAITRPMDDVTAAPDIYEPWYNEDPFHFEGKYSEALMPAGTTMVPRLLKTHVGDIYTTNMIDEEELAVEDEVSPRAADGILCKDGDGSIVWQVVKVYTMPDGQPGVKLMRIK